MSAALVGGGAVAGAAVAGPVGAVVGALVGWVFGKSLVAGETTTAANVTPNLPIERQSRVDVASQAECPEGTSFNPYTRQSDSRGDCRPPPPTCSKTGEQPNWTMVSGVGWSWRCESPGMAYTSGLQGASCGPGMTANPLPAGPQCLPTSESAYTSGGPNRSPFAGLGMVAGPRVSK